MKANENLILKSDDSVIVVMKGGKTCFIKSYNNDTERTEMMAKLDEVMNFCQKNKAYIYTISAAEYVELREEAVIKEEDF